MPNAGASCSGTRSCLFRCPGFSVSPEDILGRLVVALDSVGIPYMVTGSLALSIHGVPRATQDIDIVIAPLLDQLGALRARLPDSEYCFDLNTAREAIRGESQFNVVDLASGWKIDLIIRKSRAFSLLEFERRAIVEFAGLGLRVTSVEDTVLSKLEWAKLGGSDRQIEDVATLLRIWGETLDRPYVERWVQTLAVQRERDAACQKAELGS
jgi:hypothetical protein